MLGKDGHDWAATPDHHSTLGFVPRLDLFEKLDRRAALTLIRAPSGYGKSSLIASWLRSNPDPRRVLIWMSAPGHGVDPAVYWRTVAQRFHAAGVTRPDSSDGPTDPFTELVRAVNTVQRPTLLVLVRPDMIDAESLEDQLIELVSHCHQLDLIVTLTGLRLFPEPYLLDIDHEVINTEELLFTVEDTERLLESAGATVSEGDAAHLTALVGGLPVLVHSAVTAIKNLPATDDRDRRLEHHVQRSVDRYTRDVVLASARTTNQYEFTLATAPARTLTVETAAVLFESGEPDALIHARLVALETAGVLSRSESEEIPTWELAPAIRRSLLAHRDSTGDDYTRNLSFLAHHQLEAGRHSSALEYAVDSENWTLAVDIIEQHWVTMIAADLEAVRSALRRIPAAAADHHPVVQAGQRLFAMPESEAEVVADALPTSVAELDELGASPRARDALSAGCVRSIMLRLAGECDRATEITRRLAHLSRSALEHHPENVSNQLPIMRLQFAITYQLNGRFAESTIEARTAYWGGVSQGIDFVARNAAGSAAMSWAILGEPRQARHWSVMERKHPNSHSWLGPMVKVAGLVATALAALDSLDFSTARRALQELGHPTESEELWAFVTYAHCQLALAENDAFTALPLLQTAVAAHAKQCTPSAFATPLMRSTETDLLLALGEGNKAAALAERIVDPASNPWTLTSVARLRQRTGHPEAAIALCHQFDWARDSYPRAHMETLLVQAVAHDALGEQRYATDAWSKACSIADQTGLLRPFSTITAADVDRLESAAKTDSPALAEFRNSLHREPFPPSVHIVSLTERERTVLALLSLGLGSAAMADKLFVSVNTVKTQLRTMYRKLDAHNKNEAIANARELRLL
ncbi:LuxR family maltose regulon positive regulatory protein [Rhodococcus sp. 27YEA15]|uniref:helix-turn-helix transcriptional regulator n=1 Tax=Rhodococcus sp. 27YEA15 TaxID=3156259 RepID=UPI003C7C27C7